MSTSNSSDSLSVDICSVSVRPSVSDDTGSSPFGAAAECKQPGELQLAPENPCPFGEVAGTARGLEGGDVSGESGDS